MKKRSLTYSTVDELWAGAEGVGPGSTVLQLNTLFGDAVVLMQHDRAKLTGLLCMVYAKIKIWPTYVTFKLDLEKIRPERVHLKRYRKKVIGTIWDGALSIDTDWHISSLTALFRDAAAVLSDDPDSLSRLVCEIYAQVGIWPDYVTFKLDLEKSASQEVA